MSQHEATPHSRSAIISELACIVGEISNLQIEQARLCERTAAMQGRLGHLIRDLSTTTAITPPLGAAFRESQRVYVASQEQQDQAGRPAPASQSAPSLVSPSAQAEERPVQVGRAPDEVPEGTGHGKRTGQSGECRHDAGAADEPRVPRREPNVHTAGGGLLQDGGSLKPHGKQSDRVLDLYASTLLGPDAIAREIGCPVGNPSAYISSGRRQGDTRVVKGDEARRYARLDHALTLYATTDKPLKDIDALVGWRSGSALSAIDEARASGEERVVQGDARRTPKRSASQHAQETRAVAVAPIAAPEPRKPPAPSPEPAKAIPVPASPNPQMSLKPLAAAVDPPAAQKLLSDPERIIVADTGSGRIYGPTGTWQAIVRTAKSLAPFSDGRLYGLKKVMDAGDWKKESDLVMRLPEWAAELASIGVELVYTKGIGLKLNRIDGGAA